MTFLSPSLLWFILPFIAMPIIIHFINRMRYTPIKWAAMDFLFIAKRNSTKFAKLRERVILACRCFAIFCLALALSRPQSGGWMGWSFNNSTKTIIIVLDRSSSMAALDESGEKNKLQHTIEMIQNSAILLPRETRFILIDSATAKATSLKSLDILDDALIYGVTDATCNMSELLQVAYDYIKTNTPNEVEVWMTGDLQLSNWSPQNNQWKVLDNDFSKLTQKVNFRMLALSQKVKRNSSIRISHVERYQLQGENKLRIKLHIERNFQDSSIVPLSIKLNGNTTLQELHISGKALDYTYFIDLPKDDNGGFGVVSIPQDKRPSDDIYYFAYGQNKEFKTAIISKKPYSNLLIAAASPMGRTNYQTHIISDLHQLTNTLSQDYALIIIEGANLDSVQQKQLLSFIRRGGQALIFPPMRPNLEIFSCITPSIIETSPKSPFNVTHWNNERSILSDSAQGEKIPLSKLSIFSRQLALRSGEVIASYRDGQAFLSRYGHGKGAIYYCSSGIKKSWSTLYHGSVLLPMINRLITHGAKRYSTVTYDNCQVNLLSGFKVLEGDKKAIFKNLTAGVYIRGNQFLVLNRPTRENKTQQISEAQLRRLFGSSSFSMFNEGLVTNGDSIQTELFTFFACLVLLFLIFEGYMTLIRPPLQGEIQ